jgi:SAM-dependent methyltransferase
MNEYHEFNREGWNRRTDPHFQHPNYKVKEFLAGRLSLHPLERDEVGDVRGRKLLHLQCHFGLDTLSWACLGARVTGIDISDRSIERANELKERTGLEARFIRCDLFDLPDVLDDEFDIVYTSYGVTWWMSDIERWGQVAARYVRKGGFFYVADDYPALGMLDGDKKVYEPYFHQPEAEYYEGEGDYCVKDLEVKEYGWRWTLGDIVTSLCKAGLRIEFLHEFPFGVYAAYPTLVKDGDWWYYSDRKDDVPMTYSIKATKT